MQLGKLWLVPAWLASLTAGFARMELVPIKSSMRQCLKTSDYYSCCCHSVRKLGTNNYLLQPHLLVEHEHVLHFQTHALRQYDVDEPVCLPLRKEPGQDEEGAAAA